ncbi:MAG: hypothetical protein MUF64_19305 [Polyangiaceae bacterium]|jgi:hypothetical protein|nr:hypothetical protein [Polyangiaceae bacterium]
MSLPRFTPVAFLLLLGACAAPASKSSSAPAPAAAAAPGSMASETEEQKPPAAAPTEAGQALPKPTDAREKGGEKMTGGLEGAVPKATSPTNDTRPGNDGAGSPSQNLEDFRNSKAIGGSGSYSVTVKSAAGLAPEEVGKAVNGVASKTDACYAKVVKKKPTAGSATRFEISVEASGAGAVKMVSDGLKDGEWVKCVETALKGVSWPKPSEKTGKTTVDFTVGG